MEWRDIQRTFLPVVRPVFVDGGEVYFTKACHKRDLPEDSFLPWPHGVDVYMTASGRLPSCILVCILRYRLEAKEKLLGLEAVRGQVIEIFRRQIGASLGKPLALLRLELQLAKFYNNNMRSFL